MEDLNRVYYIIEEYYNQFIDFNPRFKISKWSNREFPVLKSREFEEYRIEICDYREILTVKLYPSDVYSDFGDKYLKMPLSKFHEFDINYIIDFFQKRVP